MTPRIHETNESKAELLRLCQWNCGLCAKWFHDACLPDGDRAKLPESGMTEQGLLDNRPGSAYTRGGLTVDSGLAASWSE
jgi:hypothetical protein